MAGWHHWLDRHEFEWTPGVGDGQGGLAYCDSWGCKESDTTEQLNWTELNWSLIFTFKQIIIFKSYQHSFTFHLLYFRLTCLWRCVSIIQIFIKCEQCRSHNRVWFLCITAAVQSRWIFRYEKSKKSYSFLCFGHAHWSMADYLAVIQ